MDVRVGLSAMLGELLSVGDGRGAEAGADVDPEFNLSEHRAEARVANLLNIEVNGLCVHTMRATLTKTELLSNQPEPPL
jgi:hypothetical protein